MERAGAATGQIIERMYRVRQEVQIVLTVDKLEYARMSGRVGTLQAALASALNVKPIIVLKEGLLDVAERVRTRSRALNRVLELLHARFGEERVNLAAVHARDPQAAEGLLEQARKIFNIKEFFLTELSIAVAANLGPGTVGLIVFPAGG
jgi:DegV family protein with EDD domain